MPTGVANGRSVRLFFPDGTANGLTIAEVMNWTGKVVAAPRARLSELIRRPEADKTGIYILLGPDPDRVSGLKAYVGEADCIGKRLRRHDDDDEKDFSSEPPSWSARTKT